ncbi:hypothetical protein OG361_13040 [Streptomyces sp. NBC_00090]|uniref:hypothetical protein n=1 Tax=Streptomyces sp. NBC_00090 TaxID=2903619 RepID=UPI003253D6AF
MEADAEADAEVETDAEGEAEGDAEVEAEGEASGLADAEPPPAAWSPRPAPGAAETAEPAGSFSSPQADTRVTAPMTASTDAYLREERSTKSILGSSKQRGAHHHASRRPGYTGSSVPDTKQQTLRTVVGGRRVRTGRGLPRTSTDRIT